MLGCLRRVYYLRPVLRRHLTTTNVKLSAHAKIYYREPPEPAPRFNQILGKAIGGFMWWWILWHLFTEPEHLTGEFPYPNPSSWTDEELGIPPDDGD